jgi:Protein of unknown function (DUF559)
VRQLLIEAALDRGAVITRAEALAIVPAHVIDKAVSCGALVRVYPSTYVLADLAPEIATRRRAAVRYAGSHSLERGAAVSHVDALAMWNLPHEAICDPSKPHVTVDATNRLRRPPGLVLHRRADFAAAGAVRVRDGMPVLAMEHAIVESWPLLTPLARRAPAIVAVRDRRTTAPRLMTALEELGRTHGAAAMRRLFAGLDDGCHSELELWGHAALFTHPDLPGSVGQFPLRRGRRVAYLDRAFVAEMVAVELDGAAYHGGPGQRERDLQRDIWVAGFGWLTVRFSHPQLFGAPDACRAQLKEILEVRRRQLGLYV